MKKKNKTTIPGVFYPALGAAPCSGPLLRAHGDRATAGCDLSVSQHPPAKKVGINPGGVRINPPAGVLVGGLGLGGDAQKREIIILGGGGGSKTKKKKKIIIFHCVQRVGCFQWPSEVRILQKIPFSSFFFFFWWSPSPPSSLPCPAVAESFPSWL